MNATKLIAGVHSLPSLPAVVLKVQSAIAANEKRAEIARVIEQDPVLAARLLRAANSSFFGVRSPIRSIDKALVLLGVNMVRNLLVMTAVHGTLRRFRLAPSFSLMHYWEHSLTTAVMAKLMSQRTSSISADDAFVAGLLHDLGEITLASLFPDERAVVLAPSFGSDLALEARTFGYDHVEVGVAIAEQWALPDFVVEGIRFHHDPAATSPLARLLRAADALALWVVEQRVEEGHEERPIEPLPDIVTLTLGADIGFAGNIAQEAQRAFAEASALAAG